jgi:hypothetical protein
VYSYDSVHQVKYSNKGPVPIREIIKSLQGFEAVARELRPVMAGAVESVEIYVKDIPESVSPSRYTIPDGLIA